VIQGLLQDNLSSEQGLLSPEENLLLTSETLSFPTRKSLLIPSTWLKDHVALNNNNNDDNIDHAKVELS
jgi:hypothetical protein